METPVKIRFANQPAQRFPPLIVLVPKYVLTYFGGGGTVLCVAVLCTKTLALSWYKSLLVPTLIPTFSGGKFQRDPSPKLVFFPTMCKCLYVHHCIYALYHFPWPKGNTFGGRNVMNRSFIIFCMIPRSDI